MNFTQIDEFVAKLKPTKRVLKMTHVELNKDGKIIKAKGTYNKKV